MHTHHSVFFLSLQKQLVIFHPPSHLLQIHPDMKKQFVLSPSSSSAGAAGSAGCSLAGKQEIGTVERNYFVSLHIASSQVGK